MKSLTQSLVAISASLTLAGCSCAIYHESWEPKGGKIISKSSLEELDGRMNDLNMRGVNFHSNNRRVGLHSSFCPTPLTLLTGGADAKAWEARCSKAEATIFDWSSLHGLKLKRISKEAEQVADGNPH
jgi:hypothetical protein